MSVPFSNRHGDIGLTIVRVVTGLIFAAHGAQKLFVFGLDGVSGAFAEMGIPLPSLVGPAVALLEFFGGLALIAGVLTKVVSAALAVDMLGALFLVHLPAGFFLPNGFEFVLALLAMTTALVLAGPGRYAVDTIIAARRAPATPQRLEVKRAA